MECINRITTNLGRLSENQTRDRQDQLNRYQVRGAGFSPYSGQKSGVYGRARGLLDRKYDTDLADITTQKRRSETDLTRQAGDVGSRFNFSLIDAAKERGRQEQLLRLSAAV